MYKILPIVMLGMLPVLTACGRSVDSYVDDSKELHARLGSATCRQDSDSIYHQIAVLESEARQNLTKQEFREYARRAHDR